MRDMREDLRNIYNDFYGPASDEVKIDAGESKGRGSQSKRAGSQGPDAAVSTIEWE